MKRFLIFLSVIILFFTACNYKQDYKFAQEPNTTLQPPENEPINPNLPSEIPNTYPPDTITQRKITKNAIINILTKDLQKQTQTLKKIIKKYNAFIIHEQQTINSIVITTKVPSENFDSLINQIVKNADKLTYKEITTDDITAQYIDIQTRLKNKKVLEQQYLKILKQAKNINEILQTTQYLQQVRTEIESTQALLNYYKNQVKYSEIQINITQEYDQTSIEKFNFWQKLIDALKTGWHLFLNAIIFILSLIPFWITILVIIFVAKRFKRKRDANSKKV